MNVLGLFQKNGKIGGKEDELSSPKSEESLVAAVKEYFEERKSCAVMKSYSGCLT